MLLIVQRVTAEADRLRADKDTLQAKLAERSLDVSLCSTTAAKAEQDLIANLQARLKVICSCLRILSLCDCDGLYSV